MATISGGSPSRGYRKYGHWEGGVEREPWVGGGSEG